MTYTLSDRAPGASDLTAKNRVWDFFEFSNKPRPDNRRQSPQPRRKIRPTATKTASGIPYWPSRDPMEEYAGLNLYGFNYNNTFNWYDYLGREPRWSDAGGLPPYDPLVARDRIPYDELLRRQKIIERPEWMDNQHVIVVHPLPDEDGCICPKRKNPDRKAACGREFNSKADDLVQKFKNTYMGQSVVLIGVILWSGGKLDIRRIGAADTAFIGKIGFDVANLKIDINRLEDNYKKCMAGIPCE